MTRKRTLSPLFVLVMGLFLLGWVGSAAAQDPVDEAPPTNPQEEAEELPEGAQPEGELDAVLGAGTTPQDDELINVLLEEDEDQLTGGFAYDDGGRRDPFRSLVQENNPNEDRVRERPEGVPGLIIDELSIEGVWITADGPVAQVRSSHDRLSLLIRPGDILFDGRVVSINYSRSEGAEVVFRQVVTDPDAPKPFREVTRRLDP